VVVLRQSGQYPRDANHEQGGSGNKEDCPGEEFEGVVVFHGREYSMFWMLGLWQLLWREIASPFDFTQGSQ